MGEAVQTENIFFSVSFFKLLKWYTHEKDVFWLFQLHLSEISFLIYLKNKN